MAPPPQGGKAGNGADRAARAVAYARSAAVSAAHHHAEAQVLRRRVCRLRQAMLTQRPSDGLHRP
jgi:hypothetical protein